MYTYLHLVIPQNSKPPYPSPPPPPAPLLLIIIHDGIQSVGDCNNRALRKLRPDGLLDQVVCLQVHGCRGLVQHQDLGLAQEGPRQTHQLTLPHAQVLTSLGDGVLEPLLERGDEGAEVGALQGVPYLLILVALKRVKVQTQCAGK